MLILLIQVQRNIECLSFSSGHRRKDTVCLSCIVIILSPSLWLVDRPVSLLKGLNLWIITQSDPNSQRKTVSRDVMIVPLDCDLQPKTKFDIWQSCMPLCRTICSALLRFVRTVSYFCISEKYIYYQWDITMNKFLNNSNNFSERCWIFNESSVVHI